MQLILYPGVFSENFSLLFANIIDYLFYATSLCFSDPFYFLIDIKSYFDPIQLPCFEGSELTGFFPRGLKETSHKELVWRLSEPKSAKCLKQHTVIKCVVTALSICTSKNSVFSRFSYPVEPEIQIPSPI